MVNGRLGDLPQLGPSVSIVLPIEVLNLRPFAETNPKDVDQSGLSVRKGPVQAGRIYADPGFLCKLSSGGMASRLVRRLSSPSRKVPAPRLPRVGRTSTQDKNLSCRVEDEDDVGLATEGQRYF